MVKPRRFISAIAYFVLALLFPHRSAIAQNACNPTTNGYGAFEPTDNDDIKLRCWCGGNGNYVFQALNVSPSDLVLTLTVQTLGAPSTPISQTIKAHSAGEGVLTHLAPCPQDGQMLFTVLSVHAPHSPPRPPHPGPRRRN